MRTCPACCSAHGLQTMGTDLTVRAGASALLSPADGVCGRPTEAPSAKPRLEFEAVPCELEAVWRSPPREEGEIPRDDLPAVLEELPCDVEKHNAPPMRTDRRPLGLLGIRRRLGWGCDCGDRRRRDDCQGKAPFALAAMSRFAGARPVASPMQANLDLLTPGARADGAGRSEAASPLRPLCRPLALPVSPGARTGLAVRRRAARLEPAISHHSRGPCLGARDPAACRAAGGLMGAGSRP